MKHENSLATVLTGIIICILSTSLPAIAVGVDDLEKKVREPDPTSVKDVLEGNPIRLTITKDAPAADLERLSGPIGLEDAVRTGLQSNLTLQQSRQTWDFAKFEARSALGRMGPRASLNLFYANSSMDQMLVAPEVVTPAPMQPIVRGNSLHLVFAGLQPLFTGGRLLGNYKLARAKERQSLESFRADRIATALKVKLAYWQAAWNEAQLRVVTDYVKAKRWARDNMKESFRAGKAIKADLMREEAELARANDLLNETYRDYNYALIRLKTVLGINLGSHIGIKDPLAYTSPAHDLNFYMNEAARARPEISYAFSKVKEMKARRVVAASKYSPQVNLYGLATNASGHTPGIEGSVDGRWGGTLGIISGITLFDSGDRLNEIRSANADLAKARIAKKDTELKVAEEVSLAWVDFDIARRNVALATKEVESAKEEHRLFHMRYLVGKSIALEDFDAAVRLFEARLKLLEVVYKYKVAESTLVWSSGGA